ncbi:hypothetical protein V5O48_009419 [Marasmius crinis-equi]|uniref:NAD(P)-binding protein n=1 Tax=Marasmius crinis-equi TaxID=585013 RepID=A0ABR3FB54_9AGAR
MASQSPRIWFITGSSLGFGRCMTEQALEAGDNVFATVRRLDSLADLQKKYGPERLHVQRLDVTIEGDIPIAFEKAKEVFGRIDLVYNNAGYSMIGEVEAIPQEAAHAIVNVRTVIKIAILSRLTLRELFQTNFWGAYNVTRAAIAFFRDVNKPVGGRLLQMCSYYGLATDGSLGMYVATKHAIDGLTDCLTKELDPAWNIKVTLIEPGRFRTDFFVQKKSEIYGHPAYTNPEVPGVAFRLGASRRSSTAIKGDPVKMTRAVLKITYLENPPKRLILGQDAIADVKKKLEEIEKELLEYESWSRDLLLDE